MKSTAEIEQWWKKKAKEWRLTKKEEEQLRPLVVKELEEHQAVHGPAMWSNHAMIEEVLRGVLTAS